VARNASDLHLRSNKPPMVRIQGAITPLNEKILSKEDLFSNLKNITPLYYWNEFENKNDTDFAFSTTTNRFRVNLFKDVNGIGAVFRHISNNLPTFESINAENSILKICEMKTGLVIVSGPTGCGKSTTLAAMINYINKTKPYHIITIEDPIEFRYNSEKSLIHQRELNIHTNDYHTAIRNVLREDPDVILIGEMRDPATIRLAIEAAETGHLVFSTLHTNSAFSTISRIINVFREGEQELIKVMLAENLKGVICQSLILREDTAQKQRIAAREIWLNTSAGANLIRENKIHQIQSILESSQDQGMFSMNASLINLVTEKIISPDSGWSYALDKKDFENRLQNQGIILKGL